MTLHGKFVNNDADFSPLTIYGVGTFMAFSGKGAYRNRGACAHYVGKIKLTRLVSGAHEDHDLGSRR